MAQSLAEALALTLKPIIEALDASASITSLSVIAPTPECKIKTLTSSVLIFSKAWTIASEDPWTSALTTSGSSEIS